MFVSDLVFSQIYVAFFFLGKNCELDEIEHSGRMQGHEVEEKQQTSNAGMVAGVIVAAVIFLAVFLLLLLYYRRRVSNLKTELAHVQYRADPEVSPGKFPPSPPLLLVDSRKEFRAFKSSSVLTLCFYTDRHHFDNPAYSYTGRATGNGTAAGLVADEGSLLPLNNMHKIHNNLGSKNNLNLERQKFGVAGCSTEDDDDMCAKGKDHILFHLCQCDLKLSHYKFLKLNLTHFHRSVRAAVPASSISQELGC